jgi:hypothetical protein
MSNSTNTISQAPNCSWEQSNPGPKNITLDISGSSSGLTEYHNIKENPTNSESAAPAHYNTQKATLKDQDPTLPYMNLTSATCAVDFEKLSKLCNTVLMLDLRRLKISKRLIIKTMGMEQYNSQERALEEQKLNVEALKKLSVDPKDLAQIEQFRVIISDLIK